MITINIEQEKKGGKKDGRFDFVIRYSYFFHISSYKVLASG